MHFLDTIKLHLAQLDEKTFFAYMGGFLLGLFLIISGLFYYYYSAVDDLNEQVQELNTKRTKMRALFERETLVKKQETEVNKMLKEDENFSIGSYFQKVVDKLKLTPKSAIPGNTLQIEGKYREYTISANFSGENALDMKQICELLEEIEANKRVYTKSLDITRAQATPTKLNVTLVIGTLLTEIPGGS